MYSRTDLAAFAPVVLILTAATLIAACKPPTETKADCTIVSASVPGHHVDHECWRPQPEHSYIAEIGNEGRQNNDSE